MTHFLPAATEVEKLQKHLQLLREQYVKLQTRLAEVEKQHQVALAAGGNLNDDNFVSRLLRTISELFDSELYRYLHRVVQKLRGLPVFPLPPTKCDAYSSVTSVVRRKEKHVCVCARGRVAHPMHCYPSPH